MLLATDNFILTVIMMALCAIFLNVVAFSFLVPALIYSKQVMQASQNESGCAYCGFHFSFVQAATANNELNHSKARKLSQRALWLNIAAVISFIVLVIVGILLGTILAFTVRDYQP